MTDYEKLISECADAEQFFKTAGFYHVASRASEIETRKLIDTIVEREGIAGDMQEHKEPGRTSRTTYTSDDGQMLGYAIPRRFYSMKNGRLEIDTVEVCWYSYEYEDDNFRHPTEEHETKIPITGDDERKLKELTYLAYNAQRDFEAVRRTAVINLLKAKGIDDTDKDLKNALTALTDYADELIEAVTKQDVDRLQDVQHDQILALEGIDDDTRKELIRFFCTKYYNADKAAKAKYLACIHSNFANNVLLAIPDGFLLDKWGIYHAKTERTRDSKDDTESLERLNLVNNVLHTIRNRATELGQKWFYEVGGEYVKHDDEEPGDDAEQLQQFADSETVIQDYTSPTQHFFGLTKTQQAVFDESVADEITELPDGRLIFTLAISKTNAKTQRAVMLDIADKVRGLTKFDKSVLNAVFSEIEAGNETFTSKQVAEQNQQTENPTSNTVGAYTKSIDKMRVILHKVDLTDHLKQNGVDIAGHKKVEIEGYLLPVEAIEITMNNGKRVKGYRLIKRPVLLDYAKDTRQILAVDNKVLDVPVNKTEKILVMRDYLIQQIGVIYNPHSTVSNNILISTVLDYAGFDLVTMDRRRKAEQIKHIKAMIEYWSKIKYIEYGYKFNYKGKSLESITINPRPKAKKKHN